MAQAHHNLHRQYPKIINFLKDEKLTDCTIAAEGKMIKAHRLVLSLASEYLRELFMASEGQNPIIVLKDVPEKHLLLILEYIYAGRIELESEDVDGFKKVADSLKIKVVFNFPSGDSSQLNVSGVSLASSIGMDTSVEASIEGKACSTKIENIQEKPLKAPTPKGRTLKKGILKKSISKLTMKAKAVAPKAATLNCVHCNKVTSTRGGSHKTHEKFCWKNENRVKSDCALCDKKFEYPANLVVHMKNHPTAKRAAQANK